MPKIETTSKAPLKPPSRKNPGRRGISAEPPTPGTAHKPPTPTARKGPKAPKHPPKDHRTHLGDPAIVGPPKIREPTGKHLWWRMFLMK